MTRRKVLKAAALAYRPESDAAPRVAASGRGLVAEKILEAARAAGIPVREDSALAEILSRLDPGEAIPAETYQAVAEILAFLYRLDRAQSSPPAGPAVDPPSSTSSSASSPRLP